MSAGDLKKLRDGQALVEVTCVKDDPCEQDKAVRASVPIRGRGEQDPPPLPPRPPSRPPVGTGELETTATLQLEPVNDAEGEVFVRDPLIDRVYLDSWSFDARGIARTTLVVIARRGRQEIVHKFSIYADASGGALPQVRPPRESSTFDQVVSTVTPFQVTSPMPRYVVRYWEANVWDAMKGGNPLWGADPESTVRPALAVLGITQRTQYIPVSENTPRGATSFSERPFKTYINLDEAARRGGADGFKYIPPLEVQADVRRYMEENGLNRLRPTGRPSNEFYSHAERYLLNQEPGNVVDPRTGIGRPSQVEREGLIKGPLSTGAVESGGMRGLRIGGRVLQIYGYAIDVYELAQAAEESYRTGDAGPVAAQGIRTVGSIGGSFGGSALGLVAAGALSLTGWGAIVLVIGAAVGGGAGGYWASDQVADLIDPN